MFVQADKWNRIAAGGFGRAATEQTFFPESSDFMRVGCASMPERKKHMESRSRFAAAFYSDKQNVWDCPWQDCPGNCQREKGKES